MDTVELGGASIKSALKRADRAGVRFVAFLGESEVAAGGVALKDLGLFRRDQGRADNRRGSAGLGQDRRVVLQRRVPQQQIAWPHPTSKPILCWWMG